MQSHMAEARRAPGSEWLKNHSRFLERAYDLTRRMFWRIYPPLKRIAPDSSARVVIWGERKVKGWVFNCQMCGQCVLHSTGMTCPMSCPKHLRNGPCGGVRPDGHCEVIPSRPCIWFQAWERSQKMANYTNELQIIQPPVNRTLQNTSSWINMFEGIDREAPPGWELTEVRD